MPGNENSFSGCREGTEVTERQTWTSIFEAEERPPTLVTLPGQAQPIAVPTIVRHENRWRGELPASHRAVPNKPAIDYQGKPLYPEFVWLRLLERAGWTGVWVKYWGRANWTDIDSPLDLPPRQAELFEQIEALTENTRGGCWDIFAWRGDDVLFVESKQSRTDRVTAAQAVWLEKSLALGLGLSSFLIAEYTVPRASKQEPLN